MGQYQQWLHYQEIDRRLRSTLNALEQELGHLESQRTDSPQPDMLHANPIISVLSAHMPAILNGRSPTQDNTESYNHEVVEEIDGQPANESMETISAALLHWGELPDFGQQVLHPAHQYEILPSLSIDHAEIELLPEDMFAFFEEHSQTDPQLELPWWLRKINITSGDDDSGKPIDQESIRTNRLVQRWVERWGRQSPLPSRPTPSRPTSSQPSPTFTPESESGGIHNEE
jgi:hypothetical protein